MKLKNLLFFVFLGFPATSIASEAGNILACINAVKAYTGKTVDEFDVTHTRRILTFSSAEWPGIKCEPVMNYVHNLTVDGKKYVIEGFAGSEAKRTYDDIEKETEDAVSLLKSRIKLLEQRLDRAEEQLKQPNPEIQEIRAFIDNGIKKATGK